ncbi:MAG: hypothetical protein ABI224_10670 [Acetobacteraceae bacterium]
MITRWASAQILATVALTIAVAGVARPASPGEVLKVGVNLSLTRADARNAKLMLQGAQLALAPQA